MKKKSEKLLNKPRKKTPSSCLVWEGASEIDGSPICLILSGINVNSTNRKTGAVIQSWIIRSDMHPYEGLTTGKDKAVCGDCPFKRSICYVRQDGLNQIWRQYREGTLAPFDGMTQHVIREKRKMLRMGSYGDPAAIPLDVWRSVLALCPEGKQVGYTQRWRNCDQRFSKWLMASVRSPQETQAANLLGWRAFRVKLPEDPLLDGEIMCTNQVNRMFTCEFCGKCDGRTTPGRQYNIADDVHGLPRKMKAFAALQANTP